MSTHGCIGIIADNKKRFAYNHFDSYPGNLGINFLGQIRSLINRFSIKELKRSVSVSEIADREKLPTENQKKRLRQIYDPDLTVSNRSEDDWYCLFRNFQGNLESYLLAGIFPDDHNIYQYG